MPESAYSSRPPDRAAQRPHPKYDAIHRAILAGLLSSIATRGEGHDYNVAGGGKANLWPGSGMFRSKAKWIVAAEQVETTRRYLRCCGRIDPRWIEPLAGHLIKRTYSDLHWESKWASAVALERLTLFGLVIVAGRPVRYGPIDADASRQLLIEHGLVEGDLEPKPAFLVHNEELLDEVQRLQAKLRQRDIVIGQWQRFAFYDQRLPAEIYDGVQLARWLRESPENARQITMTKADLLREGTDVAGRGVPRSVGRGPVGTAAGLQVRAGRGARRRDGHGAAGGPEPGRSGAAGVARAGPLGREGAGHDPLAAQGLADALRARARSGEAGHGRASSWRREPAGRNSPGRSAAWAAWRFPPRTSRKNACRRSCR